MKFLSNVLLIYLAVPVWLSGLANAQTINIYDEYIAMSGERTIKDEFSAFLRFYETVNRNRELSGESAVKCYMLGNPNTMGNAYFLGWDLVK